MNYLWLTPKDQHYNNFVFFSESSKSLVLRDIYKTVQCPCCGKFDEDAALLVPVSGEVKIRARADYVGTDDGLICVSDGLRQLLLSAEIEGLDFLAMPNDPLYWIATPTCLVPTDVTVAGFQYQGSQCKCCGRWQGVYLRPTLNSLAIPDNPKMIFAPSIWNERAKNRQTWLMCSEVVVKILKDNLVSGVEYRHEPLIIA